MRVYDFKVLLEPDETGGYVVTRPAIPGYRSQDDTIAQAMANIKEALELCLEDLRRRQQFFDIATTMLLHH